MIAFKVKLPASLYTFIFERGQSHRYGMSGYMRDLAARHMAEAQDTPSIIPDQKEKTNDRVS